MAKVSFTNLKLKTKTDVKTFKIGESEIEVLQYLPVEDKYDLVMITLQKAKEDNIYNPLKLDMYFNLHIVYMYTNLSFTEKQKEDEDKIYNTLKSNGVFDSVLELIPEEEYNELLTFIDELVDTYLSYSISAAAVIQTMINDLPKNAQIAADIINNFDKNKYQEVIAFAEAANGGRSINNVIPMNNQ